MWFLGMGTDIGIDLGTATVLVYIKDKGVVLKEPSVVAIDKNSNKILAVGEEARQMIGRTPGNIVAVRPLRDGVISDYDMTEKMLTYFIRKGCGKKRVSAPKVMVCVPSQATEVEKRAIIDASKNSGARTVYLIEEPLAAAVGAGIDINKPSGNMVVDIGGGTTDIAVISLGGIVVRSSIKIAGDKFDEVIIKYIRNKYKLMIGERTAENLKINIGSVFKDLRNLTMPVKGRNLITGLPDVVDITTEEIRIALKETVRMILEAVHSVLERTPPELAADIIEHGILMTGGGALLHGLDKYLESEIGVSVRVADDAISCVAMGTGIALKNFEKLELNKDMEVELVE
ncbi:rod shape-determining protein [Clostridium folliculivorans]|uniref:Cell shape-determining protein MreB n=1 Tax=Clostridium folliculivorans TaxID=2886038 RepID=A0A9W6D880_9CLOT|nr:rod shape-determining protein [Clostridium folliculivorans]GKU23324.1 rod shape-determining protein [Clostridium folliculivorans]GKU29441.1 rod shape-determining protein [Clostridium folliculivorans]